MGDHPNPHGALQETAAGLSRIIDSSVLRLWETIESLEDLHPRNLDRFRVCFFGSSRIPPEDPLWEEAKELARCLADAGCDVLSGGGAGLMQAVHEGASHGCCGDALSGDLPLRLLRNRETGTPTDHIYHHRTFFSRLHHFVRLSSAYIVLPGGLGTCLEAMMVWQLLQVDHIPATPFIFYGQLWDGLLGWARTEMLRNGLVSPEDLTIPVQVLSINEAVERILAEKKNYDDTCSGLTSDPWKGSIGG